MNRIAELVSDPDFTLYVGDVRTVLAQIPDESVECCVTSPPYWGLRDYGTGSWEGGDEGCDHAQQRREGDDSKQATSAGSARDSLAGRERCRKCGARRVDRQLGLEPTPEAYVENMVAVFREVRRVLRRDGTCWLNIGDSYGSGPGRNDSESLSSIPIARGAGGSLVPAGGAKQRGGQRQGKRPDSGIKPKDLVGIPWRLAFALQADDWYLRSDIVWSKPNPMPESVTDRPTKAHEYVFLLSKSPRYYYDAEAIAEPAAWERWGDQTVVKPQPGTASWIKPKSKQELTGENRPGGRGDTYLGFNERYAADDPASRKTRNARTVWEIATQPYPEAHFATYPQELVRRCIRAGCPAGGLVLDPFMGSGTTALVAREEGRKSIGIELNPDYCELAARRLAQQSLLAEAS